MPEAGGGLRVLALVGPTAAGKTSLAVDVCHALEEAGQRAEVVNADSMQLYAGMDIGTAKATLAERRGVRHHLLDIWDVRDEASVAEYQQRARATISDLQRQGIRPVLVGGSGLYVRAVLDPLDFPGTDPAVRAALEAELEEQGVEALYARLPPETAAGIEPSNGRRIVRALEVLALTGSFAATMPAFGPTLIPSVQVGLDRADLDERVERRVTAMLEAGLVQEVVDLQAHGLGRTAARALGYAQVLRHLAGESTLDEATADTVRATRRFVRRQRSWFRRDPRVTWLESPSVTQVVTLLGRVG